jgi:hypothetical protein
MWRLYLKDNEGVAIQSNATRIGEIIEKTKEKIELSKVRYLDYENETWFHTKEYPHMEYSMGIPFIHKRVEYIHEQEFRLYHEPEKLMSNEEYWESQENHKGKFIEIDLSTLVEKIWLPPTVDKRTEDKIIEMTKRSGFDFEFSKSKLNSEPYY